MALGLPDGPPDVAGDVSRACPPVRRRPAADRRRHRQPIAGRTWMGHPDVVVAVRAGGVRARKLPALHPSSSSVWSRLGELLPNPATARLSFEVLVRAAEPSTTVGHSLPPVSLQEHPYARPDLTLRPMIAATAMSMDSASVRDREPSWRAQAVVLSTRGPRRWSNPSSSSQTESMSAITRGRSAILETADRIRAPRRDAGFLTDRYRRRVSPPMESGPDGARRQADRVLSHVHARRVVAVGQP